MRFVALGIGLAVVALGIGIYAMMGGNGNRELAGGTCSGATEKANALSPLVTGDMAAFALAEEPIDLSGIAFVNDKGEPRSIADWKGRTVLLNFWATWCVPCREEMPALEALEKDLGGEDFEVVPVSIDLGTDEKPKAFYEEISLENLPFFHDGTMASFNQLKKQALAIGMPTTFLIDDQGCMLAVLHGPAEYGGEEAKALVRAAIATSDNPS